MVVPGTKGANARQLYIYTYTGKNGKVLNNTDIETEGLGTKYGMLQ